MDKPRRESNRERHEIDHGKKLSEEDTELIWGWNTPAGRLRARRRGELIQRKAELCAGMSALEIGCGTGLFTEMFVGSGARILALDISVDLLDKAISRNLPPEQVRFLALPFDDEGVKGPFTAVIGSSILHHLEIRPSLDRIYRLLEPGGAMVFAEPNMLNPQIMIQKNNSWLKKKFGDSPDETAFFSWSIRSQLIAAGFTAIEIIPFDWLHPLTPASLIPVMQRLGLILEKIPVIRNFAGSLLICAKRPLSYVNETH